MSSSSYNISSDLTSTDSGVDLETAKFNYAGNVDAQALREGYGCQSWDRPFKHKYAGYFLYNNMHDKGFYFIKEEDGVSFYDGQFYNNKLEGYGQIIFNDGKVHEGLFKDNRKFGPGVLSYPDGTQDVGLWNGNYLIRLSLSVCSDIVPTLCNNPASKVKLLRFKKIVPALPQKKDFAKDLMSGLTDDNFLSQRYPELYNPHIRNEHSLFFDRRLYDLVQLGSEDSLIEVLEDEAFVDTISEVTDSEDAICPCSNERCIHITKQISEVESELLRIHDMKEKYEKQLQHCKICCKVSTTIASSNTPESSSVSSSNTETIVDNTSITKNEEAITNQDVDKNCIQSKLGDAVTTVNVPEAPRKQNFTEIMDNAMAKTQESIKKLFMCPKEFQSDQSTDISDHDRLLNVIEKYTCTCMDEEIPNADFLMEQLEKIGIEEKFYQRVLDFLNKLLFREYSIVKRTDSSKIVKLQVEDLLTWNNGKTCIEILQHSFRYRNFENILSFRIKSIFIGDRGSFGKVGNVEAICINFLKHCVHNQLYEVRRDLFHHNVYPDLADARGNTGVHFAVAGDCHDIVRQLANVGASLDAFNDECVTPLLLSLLRYIATLNKVVFWDRAFLSEINLNSREFDQVTQWRPHESLVSLREFMESSSNLPKKDQSFKDEVKKGYESMSAVLRSRLLSSKSSSIASRLNLNYVFSMSFIDDYQKYKKAIASKKVEEVDGEELEPIAQTIELLLHYGADPNIGDLPMKPVLLSVFTKNINLVEELLKHDANPNSVNEENMSALHILSTLPFCSDNVLIAEKFLNYSTDPNRKSGNELWFDQNEELIGNLDSHLDENEDYDGKTPLQIIAMRKDFDEENVEHQCNLVRVLIEYGALYDQYYLGHTPLSMAVLRGNRKLIETLSRYVELEQPLGENMGNALTMLGLSRFPFLKSFGDCKTTIDDLISFGMNPFNPVYDFANIFEFFLYEYSHDVDFDIPRVRASLEAEDASLRRSLFSNNSGNNRVCNKLTVTYLKEIGRNILIRLYQYKSIQILLNFAEQDLLYHMCLENLARSFTVSEALDYIKLFIKENNIKMDSDYQKIILKLLNYIKVNTSKTTRKTAKKYVPTLPTDSLVLEDEVSKLSKNIQVPNYIAMYVLDDNPSKYEVCFHCMRKSDKKLVCCPCCGSVRFCSEICNKYSNKSNTKHTCNLLFYEGKRKYDEQHDTVPLTGIDLLMHEAKLIKEEERMMELQRKQAEEEEKQKKQLRRSQKMDSQLALHERKSKTPLEKSPSVSFVSDSDLKKKICCKKPSAIFICDELAQIQPRKLSCGFHCGQVIPDVHIDDEGNIVREQEFCECYPLYNKTNEVLNVNEEEAQSAATVQENEEASSKHYTLSEIYGGAYSIEENKIREAEELDTLMQSFVKDESRKSLNSTGIKLDDTETETMTEQQKQTELEEELPEEIESGGGDTQQIIPVKKRTVDDKVEQKQISKTDETEQGTTEKMRKQKIKSYTITKKKEKPKNVKHKAASESAFTKKKKSSKKAYHSESSLDTEKTAKHMVDSNKHDKKTMTPKSKKKIKAKEAGIQVNVKHRSDKSPKGKRTESTEGKVKKIKERERLEQKKATEKKNRVLQRKKTSEKKSASEKSRATDEKKASDKRKALEKKKALERKKASEHKETMEKKKASKKKEASTKKKGSEKKESSEKGKALKKKKAPTTKKRSEKKESSEKEKALKKKEVSEKKGESEKKKPPEQKKDLRRKKGSQKSKTTESAKESEYEQKKEIRKKIKTKRAARQDERVRSTSKAKQDMLDHEKFKTDANSKMKSLFDHVDKSKRTAAIVKTLTSTPALEAKKSHPDKILNLSGSSYEEAQRISKEYQYFLELIAKYFPDFDLDCLMLPFACFLDGQLYYKFAEALPYYCRTYSAV